MRLSTVSKLALSWLAVSLLTACPKSASGWTRQSGQPCSGGVTLTAAQAAQEKFVTVRSRSLVSTWWCSRSLRRGYRRSRCRRWRAAHREVRRQRVPQYEYALRGFASKMNEDQAQAMSNDARRGVRAAERGADGRSSTPVGRHLGHRPRRSARPAAGQKYTYNTRARACTRTSSTRASASRTASSAGARTAASTPSTTGRRATTATATARTWRARWAAPRRAWPRT